jgi:hypothetical protein
VFDLSLDYDDDEDLLLDWRPQGARLVCCGWGLPCILPEWWYRLLPRQRKVGDGTQSCLSSRLSSSYSSRLAGERCCAVLWQHHSGV